MLNWRGVVRRGALEINGASFVRVGRVMWFLAGGGVSTTASSKSMLAQQEVQLAQCLRRRSWRPQFHRRTRCRVEHPCRHDDDDAKRHFDMNHLTGSPLLAVLTPHSPPEQRMPPVENLNLLPDMGRMTP